MFSDALKFVIETALGLLVLAALLRFYLQLFRAPFRNPLSEFVIAITDFAVRPLRRVVPGLYGLDLSSFALAWILQTALFFIVYALDGQPVFAAGPLAVFAVVLQALVQLLRYSLYILIAAVFVQAIMSWVSPHNPIMPILDSLTRPFLRPLQRRIPPVGNVDLTPLILFVVCQLILRLPVAWLDTMARSLV